MFGKIVNNRIFSLWLPYWGILLIGLVSHAQNMLGFPSYLGDEGIYMTQAYAVAHLGRITPPPYAYLYDHSPLGWCQIALWTFLSGGFYTFGSAIDSGRVFALFLHLGTLALVWVIAAKLTRSTWIAAIVGLIYTLSPLSLWYGRQMLLDNIMMVWLLLSVWLLLRFKSQPEKPFAGKISTYRLLASGACFGIATLTKVTAIMMLPAFLYGLFCWREPQFSWRNRGIWLGMMVGSLLTYPLFALGRGELLRGPLNLSWQANSGTLLGGFLWQSHRRAGLPWETTSDFWRILTQEWLVQDGWLCTLGMLGALVGILLGDQRQRFWSLLSLFLLVGFARGGPVLGFYGVALLPLLATNFGILIAIVGAKLPTKIWHGRSWFIGVMLGLTLLLTYRNLSQHRYLFNYKPATIQRQALAWVRQNVEPNAFIVTDDDLFTDLRYPLKGLPAFPNAHSHWKLQGTNSSARSLVSDDWRKVDYVLVSPGADKVYALEPEGVPNQALAHSQTIARFQVGGNVFDIRQVID